MDGYNTIVQEVSAEQTIEKSRFIALISHVTNLDEVEQHMSRVKQTYPNARHYVYAYRLHDGYLEKCSDDGEPQGTGGRPVLDILQHRQIWDAQIIVVRYFGGILLGTGGLTRAYGRTARLAVDNSTITRMVPHVIYNLKIPYQWYEQMKYLFIQKGWEWTNEQFSDLVRLDLFIPKKDFSSFEKWLDEVTNKQVSWEKAGDILRKEKNEYRE
ncbi:MAG: YigZ family protein [Peptococcaceae bacterium]|jgi:uncharacterized YigZ family protein|nr:YigZ family protein [Peptococcaceae bacterium]